MKRYEDPAWSKTMSLGLDHNYAMAKFTGEAGLKAADLEELAPRIVAAHQDLFARRQANKLTFMELPYRNAVLKEAKKSLKPLLEWCWDVVVLGIGGSALGGRALMEALCHPQHNKLPMARRQHRPGLWFADNIDPDAFYGLLDGLDLRRTGFLVISTSGGTAETLAQFLWVYRLLQTRLGEAKAKERLLLVTHPTDGPLRHIAVQEGLATVNTAPEVPGRFSLLTTVGLVPAALVGIEVEELLAGARFMDQHLQEVAPEANLAYRLAALWYLFATKKSRRNLVFMPYSSQLAGISQWFRYLWAESIGKKGPAPAGARPTGSTLVVAQGVTDQHSQLQLYMEGPEDKLITFLSVEKFQHQLDVPDLFPAMDGIGYLGGHSFNDLVTAEFDATAYNLAKAARPSLTLTLPKINAFTLGQLVYLLEVATVAAATLFGVNPFDQPGVGPAKETAAGLLSRPGFESQREEFNRARPGLVKYRL